LEQEVGRRPEKQIQNAQAAGLRTRRFRVAEGKGAPTGSLTEGGMSRHHGICFYVIEISGEPNIHLHFSVFIDIWKLPNDLIFV
jgi:hypothetical protein